MVNDFEVKVKNRKRHRITSLLVLGVILIVAISSLLWYRANGGFNGKGDKGRVYIEIRCDALSKNMDALNDQALRDYVPEDGTILPRTEVEIVKGETSVFDVTDKVCRDMEIQIEYSYAPGYGSHYVEGINYLYEFSAGSYSGWLYSVDGDSPNYGADKVMLKGGEFIVWNYTVDYRND